MCQKEESQFAAYVGIDWGDEKHDVCLSVSSSDLLEFHILKHTPEAIEQWALELRQRFPGGSIAVCLEQSKGPLIYALLQYEFLVLYPINPQTLANYRKTFATSGAKDDPSDAALQMDFLSKHRDQLTPWIPDDPQTRTLQRLVEMRRNLVQDKVRVVNKITRLLKDYFPQALDLFTDKDTLVFCEFLLRYLEPAKY